MGLTQHQAAAIAEMAEYEAERATDAAYERYMDAAADDACRRGKHLDEDLFPFEDGRGRVVGFEVKCTNCLALMRYIGAEEF